MGDKKKKGSLAKSMAAIVVLLGVGIGAAFYFAPETMQEQFRALREMLGV